MNGISLATSRVYLDANAVIRFIESAETAIGFVFDRARIGAARIFTSELTLAEVLVAPLRNGELEIVAAYEEFLRGDDLMRVVPIDRDILIRSANFRAMSGTKTPDSIHIATAVTMQCDVLISSDRRLRMPDGILRLSIEDADKLDLWP